MESKMNMRHLEILKQGVDKWNCWRQRNRDVVPDLRSANLEDPDYPLLNGIDLSNADLTGAFAQFRYISGADLRGASLIETQFWGANLSHSRLAGANLSRACLRQAFLDRADLQDAELTEADLSQVCAIDAQFKCARLRGADLLFANLHGADLSHADLTGARIQSANLGACKITQAKLDKCDIHGVSATDLIGDPATQTSMNVSPYDAPPFRVDDIRTAGLIHMLRGGESWSRVVDTLTNRAVLILGRFTEERRKVLAWIMHDGGTFLVAGKLA
jgi:uncharacterized protein YjbI with pentapeptide repeats